MLHPGFGELRGYQGSACRFSDMGSVFDPSNLRTLILYNWLQY